jgi:uncharacterized membrane protein
MVEFAVLAIAFTIVVLLLLLLATIYYVPKALRENHDDESDHGGQAT